MAKKRKSHLANIALRAKVFLQIRHKRSPQCRRGQYVGSPCQFHLQYHDFVIISRYENDIDSFREAAKACVQAWKERLYESPPTQDPHYPAFSVYQPQIHEPVRATMLAEARKHEVRFPSS